MAFIFTYGTLMHPEIIAIVLGRPVTSDELQDATLTDFRRIAIPGHVYPTRIASVGSRIDGKLLGPITPEELKKLDRYEDEFYARTPVSVKTHDGLRDAMAYVDGRSPVPFDERQDWDPEVFEREHLAGFVRGLPGRLMNSGR